MPQKPIEFGNRLSSGSETLGGASPQATNVVTDTLTGSVLRRPGISAYSVAPSTAVDSGGIDGLHVSLDGTLYATGKSPGNSRKAYRVLGGSAVGYTSNITGNGRSVFAETEALVVFTSGQKLYKVEKANQALSLLGGDPPETTHARLYLHGAPRRWRAWHATNGGHA